MFKVQYYTTKLESERNFETTLDDRVIIILDVKYTLFIFFSFF